MRGASAAARAETGFSTTGADIIETSESGEI